MNARKLHEETEGRVRGTARRFKPLTITDDGETQRASGIVMHGEHRSDVEVLQPFGMGSVPPPGSLMVVLSIGGDQGDLVGLPVATPGKRMGKMKPGESALYGHGGQRMHMQEDGSIDIQSGVKVTLKAPVFNFDAGGTLFTLDASGATIVAGGVTFKVTGSGVAITGGTVTHDGKDIGKTHKHTGVTPGGALTGVPA
jgi:phage baseplate assembly protein V